VSQDRTKPYRCQIPLDDCACHIRVGSKDTLCEIIDLSRLDFRLEVPKGFEKTLRKAKRIELRYHGELWLVRLSKVTPENQKVVVVLDRVAELTPVKMPSPWTTLFTLKMSRQTDPRFVLVVMLAFIAACLALPGVGDTLGTAPRIKNGVHNVLQSFK
jgi:hypothetical protein